MESETTNTKLSLVDVQDALLEKVKTDTGMNSLDIKSEDITEPYISVQSICCDDSSSKTIKSDTFSISVYIVVKKSDELDIHNAIQMIQDVLDDMTYIGSINMENDMKSQSVQEDNTNKYAFLEIDLKAVYGYKCK